MPALRLLIALILCLPALAQDPPADPPPAGTPSAAYQWPVQGTVTATRLNVRARGGTQFEVVAKVLQGDAVTVVDQQGDWLAIQAPPGTKAFVPNRALAGNTITQDATRVYAGPGAVFSDIARLGRDTRVTILKRYDENWTQIQAPEHAVVWVSAKYIDLPEPPEPTVAETEATPDGVETYDDTDTETLANVENAPPIPAPEPEPEPREPPTIHQITGLPTADQRQKLQPIGAAMPFESQAIVIPLPPDYAPFSYALAVEIDGTHYPLAYLRGDDVDWATYVWQTVTIRGTKRWLDKWPRPMVDVATIQITPAP